MPMYSCWLLWTCLSPTIQYMTFPVAYVLQIRNLSSRPKQIKTCFSPETKKHPLHSTQQASSRKSPRDLSRVLKGHQASAGAPPLPAGSKHPTTELLWSPTPTSRFISLTPLHDICIPRTEHLLSTLRTREQNWIALRARVPRPKFCMFCMYQTCLPHESIHWTGLV